MKNKKRMKNLSKCQEMMTIYTTGNVLDYLYHQNYNKLISIDLLKQTNTSIYQQTNFVEKIVEDDDTTMFFIAEKQQKTILNFSLGLLNVTE